MAYALQESQVSSDPPPLMPRAPRRHTLSVCMICKNEADRIEPALASVQDWADEIIVFDSGSTDGTLEIVRRYTDRVWQTDWPGYGPQRQRSLEAARGDYVFTLDADERVTPALRDQITAELAKASVPCAVYRMPWGPIILGKRLRCGVAMPVPRHACFAEKAPNFRRCRSMKRCAFRRGRSVISAAGSITTAIATIATWSTSTATTHGCWRKKYARGKRTTVVTPVLRFVWEFFVQYLVRGLVLDGGRGFLLAVVLSQYAYHKYAALWTLQVSGAAPDARFAPELRKPSRP